MADRATAIIWTRSLDDWERDKKLMADGQPVIHLPCISVSTLQDPYLPPVSSPSGTTESQIFAVVGSPHAVRCIASNSQVKKRLMRCREVFAIGEVTAATYQRAGLGQATVGPWKSMQQLAQHLVGRLPKGSIILSPGPVDRAYDIVDALGREGFEVHRIDLYRTESALTDTNGRGFSQESIAAMRRDLQGVVCFASPSAVMGFCQALEPVSCDLYRRLAAVVIGETTRAEALDHFDIVHLAEKQSLASLYEAARAAAS